MKALPDIDKVKEIASKVRKGMELFAPTINDAINGNENDLTCYCAIASHALHTAFKKAGIESKIIIGFFDENDDWDYNDEGTEKIFPNHCWVEIPFHYVDITATQYSIFADEKVVILPNDADDERYYPLENFKSVKSMQARKRGWGRQSPRLEYTKEILTLANI